MTLSSTASTAEFRPLRFVQNDVLPPLGGISSA